MPEKIIAHMMISPMHDAIVQLMVDVRKGSC